MEALFKINNISPRVYHGRGPVSAVEIDWDVHPVLAEYVESKAREEEVGSVGQIIYKESSRKTRFA